MPYPDDLLRPYGQQGYGAANVAPPPGMGANYNPGGSDAVPPPPSSGGVPPPPPSPSPGGSAPFPGQPGVPLPPEWLNRGPGPGDVKIPTTPGGPVYDHPGSAQNGPTGGGAPAPAPAPGAGEPQPSQEDIDAYNRWLERLARDRDARNNPAPPAGGGGPSPAPPAAPPTAPPAAPPATPEPPKDPDVDVEFRNKMRQLLVDMLSGKVSRFSPEVMETIRAQNLRSRYQRGDQLRNEIQADAVRSGMANSGETLDRLSAASGGLEAEISAKEQQLQVDKAQADVEDRLHALERSQVWLDSWRQYVLSNTKTEVDKKIAESQLALAYAQLAQQKELTMAQLAQVKSLTLAQLAQNKELTLLQLSKMGGGGGGGNPMGNLGDLFKLLGMS